MELMELMELNSINRKIEKEYDKVTDNLNKYQKYFKEEMKEIENFKRHNSIQNFEKSPHNLVYKNKLATDRRNSGLLKNIAVYVKNNIGYLVYQEMNYNLNVLRIYDKSKYATLIGHKGGISVIRYYNKNEYEDYILSSDRLVIVWDINDNFNKKYTIQESYKETIFDALILFNVFNKDYILLSSDNQHNYNEYSKLYEFKENTPFVKDIYNTNKNKNAFLIPWLFKNKYYLIALCDYDISINNIFEEENYANFAQNSNGSFYCGFLYNDNFLCVSDIRNNYINIYDLVKKTVYNTINIHEKFGYEMVQWNDEYTIVGSNQCFIIIDIEEGEEVKKIKSNNGIVFGLKKIKDEELGECLVCSEENNTICIYQIVDD